MSFSNAQANMESRIAGFEKKEKQCIARKEKAVQRINTAREKLRFMKEVRAERQDTLERKEYKLGQLEQRLKTVEYRMDAIKQSMRSRNNANGDIAREEQKLNDTLKKQSELQANMIRNMRRRDTIEKQILAFQEKESKYREKMKELKDKLSYRIARGDECKKSILEKVDNIKKMHAAMLQMEPKLREMVTRMRCAEVTVLELEKKITSKENEIRAKHKDCLIACDHIEMNQVKFERQRERKYKGPEALRYLQE